MVQQYPTTFPTTNTWTLARFVHAYTLVASRSIELNVNDIHLPTAAEATEPPPPPPRYAPVLIPGMDFFNHPLSSTADADAPHFQVKENRLEMIAQRTYGKNEEVFVVYGLGTAASEGHLTETGSGSTASFIHHYNFWKEKAPPPFTEDVEYLRVSLTYVLQHDQSGCGGATETGIVEHWRRNWLQHLQLESINQIRIATTDGSIHPLDLIVLRIWTICPAYVLEHGTAAMAQHLQQMVATVQQHKKGLDLDLLFLEKNNEVAVRWMVMQTSGLQITIHLTTL